MRLFTPGSLLAGLLLTAVPLREAAAGGGDLVGALLRFVVASAVAGAALSLFHGMLDAYARGQGRAEPPPPVVHATAVREDVDGREPPARG